MTTNTILKIFHVHLIFFAVDGDLSINKLQFLKARAAKKDSATLVAGGPRGHIHFWNVFQGGTLMAQFPGVSAKTQNVVLKRK